MLKLAQLEIHIILLYMGLDIWEKVFINQDPPLKVLNVDVIKFEKK